jgi:hypothetical protein
MSPAKVRLGNGAPLSWCRAEVEKAARNPSADAVAGEKLRAEEVDE